MKTILIVGGAGFIGFTLVKRLISEGYDIKIFDNFSNPSKNYFDDSLSIIRGDITDKDDEKNRKNREKTGTGKNRDSHHFLLKYVLQSSSVCRGHAG